MLKFTYYLRGIDIEHIIQSIMIQTPAGNQAPCIDTTVDTYPLIEASDNPHLIIILSNH